MRIVLMGPPGCGKGTQGQRLSQRFEIPHISTGAIFRAAFLAGDDLGQKAKAYMESGQLVPDEFVMEIVCQRLDQEDCRNGYILDGFPRTKMQAEGYAEYAYNCGARLNAVVNVEIPEAVLVDRIIFRRYCPDCGSIYHLHSKPPLRDGVCDKCNGDLVQRIDDKQDVFNKRMVEYRLTSGPLIAYYCGYDLHVPINGLQAISKVFADITNSLKVRQ